MLTRRNRDAAALNRSAREVLRAEGVLKGEDVMIPAIDRDKDPHLLALARGDLVRFGETLSHHGIRNGACAVVEAVEVDQRGSRLRVRLEDGRIVEDAAAGFVRQTPGGRAAARPRLVHAYAGTVYSVQGRTAAAAIMYIAGPTDARELYVGMTRHTQSVTLVAERDRLESSGRHSRNKTSLTSSTAELHQRLFAEARRYSDRRNVVDCVEDRAAFTETGAIPPWRSERRFDLHRAFEAGRQLGALLQRLGDGMRIAMFKLRTLAEHSERTLSNLTAYLTDKLQSRL